MTVPKMSLVSYPKAVTPLIDSLRSLIKGIISRSTQLAAASEQTSTITGESSKAIRNQQAQVEQAATATTEMSSTSQTVSNSAQQALHEIKNAEIKPSALKTFQIKIKPLLSN